MNRIPERVLSHVIECLNRGISTRTTSVMTGVCKATVFHIVKRHGIKLPKAIPDYEKWGRRDRTQYLATYKPKYSMTEHERLKWRERIHGHIALWLAKNKKPQSVDRIFDALRVQFPDLGKQAMRYMLTANSWGCYRKVGSNYTFIPPDFYLPWAGFKPGKLTPYPEMHAAIATYYQLSGVRDEGTEEAIERLKMANEDFIRKTHAEAVRKSLPQLKLMATAAAIGSYHESNDA